MGNGVSMNRLACVASVSVWFRRKERLRSGIFGFGRTRNETRAKNERGGRGEEGRKRLTNPRFWKPSFASERSAWLARLVEQYWHVSIKGLFHTKRFCMVRDTGCYLFWSARFALQCKSIFFDFFWNAKLFLWLKKGFKVVWCIL